VSCPWDDGGPYRGTQGGLFDTTPWYGKLGWESPLKPEAPDGDADDDDFADLNWGLGNGGGDEGERRRGREGQGKKGGEGREGKGGEGREGKGERGGGSMIVSCHGLEAAETTLERLGIHEVMSDMDIE
jgi:hypothetical protein